MKEGQKAPALNLLNQDGEQVKLSSYKDQWVVLYFYPRDNTPGCTLEAMEFTSTKKKFESLGAVILGVSKDSVKSHKSFCDKRSLKLNLLSDEDHSVQEKYEVWRPKKFMGREFLGTVRSTFLIDPSGKIAAIWDPVSVSGHVEEVLKKLKELQ